MIFRFGLWPPFGSHFGGVLGAQMEIKAIKKPPQKNIKTIMPNMTPKWSQRGSQNGAKITKMGSKNHPKTGFQKNIEKLPFSAPLNVAKVCKGHQNR